MQDLVKNGEVTRGYMGILPQSLNPALAKQFKLHDNNGALVAEVVPKGPADKAGIQTGDVIVEFNGKKIADSRHLKFGVARTRPGETVPVKVLRDNATKTLQVTVTELPGAERLAKASSQNAEDNGTLNGVTVSDLDPNVRRQFRVPENIKGAVVTEVEPNSASAEAGIQAGDIIQEIDRHPVKNAEQAVQLTEKTDSKSTLLRIWRNGGSHYLVVDESKAG
jgi:serine protease Do